MNDLERLVLAAAGSGRVLNQTDELRWLAHKHAEDQTKFIESGGTYDYATCGPHSWMVSPPQGGQSEHLSILKVVHFEISLAKLIGTLLLRC